MKNLTEAKTVTTSESVTAPLTSLSLQAQVEAWLVLDRAKDLIEARLAEVRVALLAAAESQGTQNEKGGSILDIDGLARITREKRQDKSPDEKKLLAMLAEASVPPLDIFDETKTLTLNPSKLEHAINTGKIKSAAVEALKKVTWALKVTPSDEAEAELGVLGALPKKAKK